MKLGNKKYYIFSVIGLLVVIAIFLGLRPQPVLVEVVQAKVAPMSVTVQTEGKTRVKDRYQVSVPVSGYIRRLRFDVGDEVTQGQVLTELEPLKSNVLDARSRATAEAKIAAANAAFNVSKQQVSAAQADLDVSQAEYERKIKLNKTQFISEEEITQLEAEKRRAEAVLRSAKFAVDVARYELDAAKTLLKYSAANDLNGNSKDQVAIKSPVNGSILKIYRKSEGVVNSGEPLFELGDSRALEVEVDVLSYDAVKIHPGVKVLITRWGGEPLDGVVRVVEPVGFTEVSALGVEEQRVWIIVDITSPQEQWLTLGDGYRVEAAFYIWQKENVLQIPNAALFRHEQQWAAFVDNDGEAELRPVTIGQQNGLFAEVLSGINENEWIVVHPDDKLEHTARIRRRQ